MSMVLAEGQSKGTVLDKLASGRLKLASSHLKRMAVQWKKAYFPL